MSAPQPVPNNGRIPSPRRITFSVHDCSVPQPDPSTAPLTELFVQLSIAAEAHQDDVAVVMEKLQAAMKDAQQATGNRIKLTMALPDIVRSELVRTASAAG